ncbi:c-type cytochrome [Halomonas huangheensis]|uniref:Cytochrome c domain-containing protein n=1 Tax=Halomonas huangheensis TaxID=1178482 RepID=W1N2X2_9GAMM|nr:cytochrome c [Halomonas huangheensis]ALM51387.1 hypothetical protein AR456_03055 [Halomonas huangheensis]ERL49829.1 hypothetical protein BJB45_01530 [Halomonas huangheensis]
MIVTVISRWLVVVALGVFGKDILGKGVLGAGVLGALLATGGIATAQAEEASSGQHEQGQKSEGDKEAADDTSEAGDYTIVDGKVDQGTYDGYLTYSRVCQACHGPDGMGSSFAPSLKERVKSRTFADFAGTVAGGMEIQPGLVMPAFADDPNVMNNLENIYSYLKARAADDIERGRPEVMEDASEEESRSDDV